MFFAFVLIIAALDEPHDEVRDEQDLLSAQQRGAFSSTSFDASLELIRSGGIDLATTTREELGNIPGLSPDDIEAILATRSATLSQRARLLPFLRGSQSRGQLRLLTQFTAGDTFAPPILLSGRAQGPLGLSAGVLITSTRLSLATPRVDGSSFVTPGFGYHLHLPRLYLEWRRERLRLVAGTFTVGFAERLTLDTTRRATPGGFATGEDFRHPTDLARSCRLASPDPTEVCPEGRNRYLTPDFDVREVFRGLAVSLEGVSLGEQRSLAAYAFLSYQTRSAYQYELINRRDCADATGCSAPMVYLEGSDARAVFSTLPYLYNEFTGGAHAQLAVTERLELGVTGYAAAPTMPQSAGLELGFQPWSRHPAPGVYGALGVNGLARIEEVALHFEATRSFAPSPGAGGGFGAIARAVWRAWELSVRFYDTGFTTPNARPISAPDEYDGQRARNELGARVSTHHVFAASWSIFARLDLWVLPFANARVGPAGMANLFALARIDFIGSKHLRPGVWLETRNRNLASSQHGRCASGTVIFTEGQPFDCSGDLYRVAVRLDFTPAHALRFTAQSALTLSDDRLYPDRFRVDFQQWLEARGEPLAWLQWRARTRYLNQDVDHNASLEHSWWSFIELAWLPSDGTRLAARYDAYVWLDSRAVTLARSPNPEHRLSLDLRTTF